MKSAIGAPPQSCSANEGDKAAQVRQEKSEVRPFIFREDIVLKDDQPADSSSSIGKPRR